MIVEPKKKTPKPFSKRGLTNVCCETWWRNWCDFYMPKNSSFMQIVKMVSNTMSSGRMAVMQNEKWQCTEENVSFRKMEIMNSHEKIAKIFHSLAFRYVYETCVCTEKSFQRMINVFECRASAPATITGLALVLSRDAWKPVKTLLAWCTWFSHLVFQRHCLF